MVLGERRQRVAVDDLAVAGIRLGRQQTSVDPTPYGVVADAEVGGSILAAPFIGPVRALLSPKEIADAESRARLTLPSALQ